MKEKRFLGILLVLTLMIGMMAAMSAAAYADDVEYYKLWVGSTQVTSANMDDVLGDGTVSYTPALGEKPGTLTLTNVSLPDDVHGLGEGGANIYSEDIDLKIILKGSNILGSETKKTTYGIYNSNSRLTFEGPGTLAVYATDNAILAKGDVTIGNGANVTATAYENSCKGIASLAGVIIKGGTVNATAYGEESAGIYSGAGNVTISGGTVNATAAGEFGMGIYSSTHSVIINGGTVKATANRDEAKGIYSVGDLTIKGGNVIINADIGIIVKEHSDITIKGGNVKVIAELGVYAKAGDLTITGGNVTATCGGTGICADGDLVIKGGIVKVTAKEEDCKSIEASYNVIISGGTVITTAKGDFCSEGIYADRNVYIKGGTVKATAYGGESVGIFSVEETVKISGGTVTAAAYGDDTVGIFSTAKIVKISGGNVIVIGEGRAIYDRMINTIAGTGWTNVKGTRGKTKIPINTKAQRLTYKKMQFTGASVTVNVKTVSAAAIDKAVKKAGLSKNKVKAIILGKNVSKISANAFKNYKKAKTLTVKTTKLKKSTVRNSLKGSKITKVKVRVGSKSTNKKYVKKYKIIFTKKNAGKKVSVGL